MSYDTWGQNVTPKFIWVGGNRYLLPIVSFSAEKLSPPFDGFYAIDTFHSKCLECRMTGAGSYHPLFSFNWLKAFSIYAPSYSP